MPTGDSTHANAALHRAGLHRPRRNWLAPSPPLAVDDEPHWQPAADPAAGHGVEGDLDIAPSPAGKT
jgi:hypothetical protein